MKRIIYFILSVFIVLTFIFAGCIENNGSSGPSGPEGTSTITPTLTNTGTITQTPTVTATTVTYSISGKVLRQIHNPGSTNSGVTINVYKLDSSAGRIGGAVATFVSAADGSYGPFQAEANTFYEAELSKSPFLDIYHYYLPYAVADRTDVNCKYRDVNFTYPLTCAFVIVSRDVYTKNILSTDVIKVDGGANINNAVVSPGFLYFMHIVYTGTGDSYKTADFNVTGSSPPGTFHTIEYQAETRNIRAFPLNTNHVSVAVFY